MLSGCQWDELLRWGCWYYTRWLVEWESPQLPNGDLLMKFLIASAKLRVSRITGSTSSAAAHSTPAPPVGHPPLLTGLRLHAPLDEPPVTLLNGTQDQAEAYEVNSGLRIVPFTVV
jgi:hypothetical protein